MANFYRGEYLVDGEAEPRLWRAVVENRRAVIQSGDASKTYNRLETPADEAMCRSLAESLILDSINGPRGASA